VKCKFYFNNDIGFTEGEQTGQILQEDRHMTMSQLGDTDKYTEVSFMIFRTGSCLIVGNCTERILRFVYSIIRRILSDEYANICVAQEVADTKIKVSKPRKKIITLFNPSSAHNGNANP
jgi:hypothetical protein